MMSSDPFDIKILTDKLSKLNTSQQSIQSLSRWCITHRKKARQIVETWEKLLNAAMKERSISFLYLANDILQNSRRKGTEFVNEFWKFLPGSLKNIHRNGDDNEKKTVIRLVEIWEERKVFGSRAQNLKDEILGGDPPAQAVSNGKSTNSNPIKIVKKDAQSLRIKLAVGELVEKIVTAFHSVHEGNSNEEDCLAKCNAAVLVIERLENDVADTMAKGGQPDSTVLAQLQEQENILQQCVGQLESAEASRVDLLSQLRAAVHDQETNLGIIHHQLEAARIRIEAAGNIKQMVSSPLIISSTITSSTEPAKLSQHGSSTAQTASVSLQFPTNQSTAGVPPVQIPQQPPSQPATSFAALASTEEEKKKAAAAAIAAMLAASTSSELMLTSALSSLVAEEAAARNGNINNMGNSGFTSNSPSFPLEKRQRLEGDSSNNDMGNTGYLTPQRHSMPILPPGMQPMSPATQMPSSVAPSPAQPLPPSSVVANQFLPPTGMMMAPMTYSYPGSSQPPPPPLPPPQPFLQQQPPPQPHQHQSGAGGYYGPPGFGSYGHSHQPSTPPVHRQ